MTSSAARVVRTEQDGAVVTITLDRPDKLNAIDDAMLAQLEAAVAAIEASSDVRAVVLTGAGDRAFSVGADVGAWSSLEPLELWRRWNRAGNRVFERVARLRQPVVAAVDGFALGGGLELALAADVIVASERAELGLPEVTLGTVPGWAGTQRLPLLVGPMRAKVLALGGGRIDAATAERWGLVARVVPAEELAAEARALAAAFAANAPVAVQAAKGLVDAALGRGATATLDALAGGLTAATDDLREGVAAFRERRRPEFRGT